MINEKKLRNEPKRQNWGICFCRTRLQVKSKGEFSLKRKEKEKQKQKKGPLVNAFPHCGPASKLPAKCEEITYKKKENLWEVGLS